MIITCHVSGLNENDSSFWFFLADSTKYYTGLFRGFIWIKIYFAGPHQLYFKLPSVQPAQQIKNVCMYVCMHVSLQTFPSCSSHNIPNPSLLLFTIRSAYSEILISSHTFERPISCCPMIARMNDSQCEYELGFSASQRSCLVELRSVSGFWNLKGLSMSQQGISSGSWYFPSVF